MAFARYAIEWPERLLLHTVFRDFCFCRLFSKMARFSFRKRLGEGGVNEAIFNGLQAFVFVL